MCHFPIPVNCTAVACWIFLDVIFGNLVRVTGLESKAFDPSGVSGLQTSFLNIRVNWLVIPRHGFRSSNPNFKNLTKPV